MTVSTEVNHNEYTGNGVTTSFPYTFRIFKASDLVVTTNDTNGVLRTLTLNTDYTVTGVGSYSGGAVVLPLPLANGWAISIERSLPVVQETDLRNQGKFFAETHEGAFDYLTMLIQQCFGWLRLALLKPSFIARYYDAKQNRIANLSDPGAAQDAVNNRSMRNYVDAAIAGVVGGFGWFIQYGAGAVYRTFQDKMRDAVSPKDFNIKGDGSTNDTAAFSVLETTFSNLDIDLQGKTYFVDAIPSGNRYYNGQWLLPVRSCTWPLAGGAAHRGRPHRFW
ncbi:N terminal extension of bacteriophage endosialidase [Kluyvera cryocrescens]|uniref:N terminal extension of bacteriophage endosialidase n=1 Tax=Kluyvera cryocrescens TaxID=580 RepID=A0A485ATF1_KLUCR|nr:N terminal extension of bacteriophage endosialidase [Kluyvera cryocrescens]